MKQKSKTDDAIAHTLRTAGFRATPARIAILNFFEHSTLPAGVKDIQRTVTKPRMNETTMYRILNDFVEQGLILPIKLHQDHTSYELASRNHHHHLVCEHCGLVSDIGCYLDAFEKQALKTGHFASINHHSLELYGTCSRCAHRT